MPERDRPLLHLACGLEELLLACARALALWRAQLEAQEPSASEPQSEELLKLWSGFGAWAGRDLLPLLQQTLRSEHERWAQRAAADPAARRVRDLCSALLDVIGPERYEAPPTAPRRAPRRPRAGAE